MKTKFEKRVDLVLGLTSMIAIILTALVPPSLWLWMLAAIAVINIVIPLIKGAIAAHLRNQRSKQIQREPVTITYTIDLGGEVTTGILTYRHETKDIHCCKYFSNNYLMRCAVHPELKTCEGCRDFESNE